MNGYTLPKKGAASSSNVVSRDVAADSLRKQPYSSMMAELDDSDSDSDDYGGQYASAKQSKSGAPGLRAANAKMDSDSDSDDDIEFDRAPNAASQPKVMPARGNRRSSWGDDDEVAAVADEMSKFSAKSAAMNDSQQGLHFEQARRTAMRPCLPDEPMVQCYVVREKRHLMRPRYLLYLENPDNSTTSGEGGGSREGTFLLAAQKRLKNKTSNYLIAHDHDPTNRKSKGVVGKLRSNWSGSDYMIYDQGLNAGVGAEEARGKDGIKGHISDDQVRQELGRVMFEYDQMGPGKMQVVVPYVTEGGARREWRPRGEEPGLAAAGAALVDPSKRPQQQQQDHPGVMLLVSKRPKWDNDVGGHVLNFHGRVTCSSVKNFQMQVDGSNDETVLQFGRTANNRFSLDYKYPLSALQAFAISLASVDGKLADSKGFDMLNKMAEKDAAE